MANEPLPAPPLDGVPPSPPGVQTGGPNPTMNQLNPTPSAGGNIQIAQIGLQLAADIAKGIDLLSQVVPAFQPTAAMLLSQLRDGFKTALQQGLQGSEPSQQPNLQALSMMQGQPQQQTPAPQQGPPSLPSGF